MGKKKKKRKDQIQQFSVSQIAPGDGSQRSAVVLGAVQIAGGLNLSLDLS